MTQNPCQPAPPAKTRHLSRNGTVEAAPQRLLLPWPLATAILAFKQGAFMTPGQETNTMRSTSTSVALRQARQHLLESGQCPLGLVDERLARSWQRSLDSGLLPTGRLGNPDNLEHQALRQLRGHHQELLAHSRPVMEY
eukprot:gene6389-8135_t